VTSDEQHINTGSAVTALAGESPARQQDTRSGQTGHAPPVPYQVGTDLCL
jgi:hypothetical protein